jgi:hypothetical protein
MMTELRREMVSVLESRTIEDMLRLAPHPETLAFEI